MLSCVKNPGKEKVSHLKLNGNNFIILTNALIAKK